MSERRPGVRFVVRGLTQRLPGRRGAAARAVLVGARDLVTGRGPASTYPPGDPAIDPLALVRARRAADRGDDANALAILATILARHPDSIVALSIRREIEERQGRWPETLATIRAMRAVRDTRDLARAERDLVGRILLDDPRWLPRVPGPQPAAGRSGAILHLLVAGGEASTNDHEQMPAERAIRAERVAGLTPVVLRVPGPEAASRPRPRSDGGGGDGRDTSGSEVEAVAWPIDLPGGLPIDRRLTIEAWLAARLARRIGPDAIHIHAGADEAYVVLVGLAVGDHIARPVVVELSALPSPRTALRSATADAVIVARQAFAQPVIAHGLDPDRVALIDPSRTASDEQLGVSYRSVYGRAEAAAAARMDALARPA